MSERKLTDAYWIEIGASRERESIVARLESYLELTKFSTEVEGAIDNPEWDSGFSAALALVKGDPLKELQRLAEETGEHENFDNPLIDRDSN